MTDEERRSLAQQITTNPLFTLVMDDMEKSAIERLIYAKEDTVTAQLRVQAVRTFREDLKRILSIPPRKSDPA